MKKEIIRYPDEFYIPPEEEAKEVLFFFQGKKKGEIATPWGRFHPHIRFPPSLPKSFPFRHFRISEL